MTMWGKSGTIRTAAAAALLLPLAGCGDQKAADAGADASELGFRHYRGAVQYPGVDKDGGGQNGLNALVPYGDCVLGLGMYSNGYRDVGVNWTGDKDCTELSLDPAPGTGGSDGPELAPGQEAGGWNGGGLFGRAVLAAPDGSVYAAQSRIARRDASGRIHGLADLEVPDRAPDPDAEPGGRANDGARAMVRSGGRLVIGGTEAVQKRSEAVVWISEDNGKTVRRTSLPAVRTDGGSAPARISTGVVTMAAEGRRIVAVGGDSLGQGRPRLPVWVSSDAGRTWKAALTPRLHGYSPVRGMLWHDGRWIVYGARGYGGTEDYGKPERPFAMTSADGLHWTVENTSALGEGWIQGATVDGAGKLVLLGRRSGRNISCGMVWTGGFGKGARRAELGCAKSLPTALTTRADGKVVIAGSNDLWVGGSAAG
ncbi:hypothetical protein HUT19_11410 [Streptomyces sp. NA02950]|uniref:hypothetical protein n=1 Tax=Streptomyces sp. NA02950 TaxID=2742137 RepID=UPI00159009B4|nr:hypothetical protein [Streptomyces sp. NA02950]QKV92281.1 hypothetical protein HUT19_11410 [Streptomyces sp. NA02950]